MTKKAILLLFVSFCGCYRDSPQKFRENVLRQDLKVLRQLIDGYTEDHKRCPKNLKDLVTAGYLKEIPQDPITGQRDWKVVNEDEPGCITDIHSASNRIGTDGAPYNSW